MINNPFQKNPEDFCFKESPLNSEVRERFKKAKNLDEIIRMANKSTEVIEYLMEGNNYFTLDEANAFLKQIQDKWNTTPRSELFEHSPNEAAYLLYDLPFKDVIRNIDLSSNVKEIEEAPLYCNWVKFLSYISSNEVSATAQGNLNRKAVNELKDVLEMEGLLAKHKDWIHNENEWEELNDLRFYAEIVSMIRRCKKRWLATKKCKNIIQKNDKEELFIMLFDAWFNRLDWGSVARTGFLKEINFQNNRYFLLSALLRTASTWTDYYEFLRVLHDDFLRLKDEEREFGNDVRNYHFSFIFHYPFFKYLERMNILEILREKKEARSIDSPTKFRVSNFGKNFVQSLLKAFEFQRG